MKIFIIKMSIGLFFMFMIYSVINTVIWIASKGTVPFPNFPNWLDLTLGFMTAFLAYAVGTVFYETYKS